MKYTLHFLISLFCISTLSCIEPAIFPRDISGVWVGGQGRLDADMYFTIPTILHFSDTGSLTIYNTNSSDTIRSRYELKESVFKIDTTDHSDLRLRENILSYDVPYRKYFWRPLDRRPTFNYLEIRTLLRNKVWKLDDEILSFAFNEKVKVCNSNAKECRDHCWNVIEKFDLVFLIIKGNQLECNSFSRPAYQIIEAKNNKLKLACIKNGKRTTTTASLVPDQSLDFRDTNFQLCNSNLYRNFPGNRYYSTGTKLKGGHYNIWKQLNDKMEYDPEIFFNGLFKVDFVVNCQGESGRFSTMAFDREYKQTSIPEDLSSQLLEITANLGPWSVPRRMDAYCYVTYRIENGKIVDILP